jgi:hypothetical protein
MSSSLPVTDLFASDASKQTKCFYSWNAFDNPEGIDALSQSWDFTLAYAFPPVALLESGEEVGNIERHLHPDLFPVGSPDMASIASDVEGVGGSTTSLPGRPSDGSDDGQAPPDPAQPSSSRLEDLWRLNSLQDLPGNAKNILKAGWRSKTEDRYERPWQAFKRYLRSTKIPLDKVGVKHILTYLAHLHDLVYAFRTISLHRSTISVTIPFINGVATGSNPLISRMCKGVFEKRPPPRKIPKVWTRTQS